MRCTTTSFVPSVWTTMTSSGLAIARHESPVLLPTPIMPLLVHADRAPRPNLLQALVDDRCALGRALVGVALMLF